MAPNKTAWYQGDQRRECVLSDYNLLRSAGSEKRCQLKIGIPLPGPNLVGAPSWIQDDYQALVKSASISKRTVYDSKEGSISGMTMELWSTEKIRSRLVKNPLTGCTLRPLYMERTGKDDAKVVTLYFVAYASASKEIHDWAYDFDKATFWASFDLVQSELDLSGDVDDEDDDED